MHSHIPADRQLSPLAALPSWKQIRRPLALRPRLSTGLPFSEAVSARRAIRSVRCSQIADRATVTSFTGPCFCGTPVTRAPPRPATVAVRQLQAVCQIGTWITRNRLFHSKQQVAAACRIGGRPRYVNRLSAEVDSGAATAGQPADSTDHLPCRCTPTRRASSNTERCRPGACEPCASAEGRCRRNSTLRGLRSAPYTPPLISHQGHRHARDDLHGFVMLLTECSGGPVHHWSRPAARRERRGAGTVPAGLLQQSRRARGRVA
jgi:hypothetical protein